VAKDTFGTDVSEIVSTQKDRPIVSIFNAEIEQFSKYRLAKAYVRWTRENDSSALSDKEREQWTKLIEKINHLLK
ncbi:hypothetical protein, partial [Vibrio anguillarum]